MNLTAEINGAAPPGGLAGSGPRLWGMTAHDLHDRYWASKGVGVVRPGSGEPVPTGPALYLLLDVDDLVDFEWAPVVRQMHRLRPRLMRIRIRDDHAVPYSETVVTDGADRFIAIRRLYRGRTHSTARGWLTASRSLAVQWATARDAASGRPLLRKAPGCGRPPSHAAKGRVFDGAHSIGCDGYLKLLTQRWAQPGAVIDDTYEFEPGVWLHDAVAVPPGVRFVGRAWIGAGASLSPNQVVIGPLCIADAPGVHAPVGPIEWDGLRTPTYRLFPKFRRRRRGRFAKRLFDIVFSILVLVMAAPLFPVIGLMIFIEDGWPFLFAHTRQTLHDRQFPCYKFRTMCRNAEMLKARLVAGNVCDGPQFYIENDPRVLRVGRFLRKSHLDELPQFWNVLLGHMSVVGPRPSPDRENQYCPAWREARLSVRPGVTGLWQVRRTRAPETDFQEWIRYDLEYVQHASWKLDFWIITQTVLRMFRS